MSKPTKFKIDVTPSWSFTVKGLLLVIETHLKKTLLFDESEAWLYIKKEFTRCGDLADRFADEVRAGKTKPPTATFDHQEVEISDAIYPKVSVKEIEETIRQTRSSWEDTDYNNGEDESLIHCKYRAEGFIDALEYVLGRKVSKDAFTEVKG